jgi:hypothetical protein
MSDALGDVPAFSSADANAATELTGVLLSTNGSGGIAGWGMAVSTATTQIGITNPTFIGGSGFPLADFLVGNGGNSQPLGWNLGNGATACGLRP